MPKAKRGPNPLRDAAVAAARDLAGKLFDAVVDGVRRQPVPGDQHQLPTNNQQTVVQVTLLGRDRVGEQFLPDLDDMSKRRQFMEPATYMVFDTNTVGEVIVLMQMKLLLACSAAQAEQDCHRLFSSEVDGHGMLGYHFAILEVR